jgi:dehydratase
MSSGVTALAPATAASGSNFAVQLTADPIDVPTEAGGYAIKRLSNVKIRFQVPAGASFVGATLSGGSNLGSGTPTVSASGSVVTMTIPGPLAPGTTAVLPTVTATLKATGTAGTVLRAQLAGSSYSSPSISFTATVRVLFFDTDAPTNCYAPTNPILASTTIS